MSPKISGPFREAVWYAMLDADLNYRYWDTIGRKYFKRERAITIFLAIISSSAVASWGFWQHIDIVWKILTGCSAILAIINPILNIQKTIQIMAALRSNWHNLFYQYEKMWLNIESNTINLENVKNEYGKLRDHEARIDSPTANLPLNKKIRAICHKEVLNSRNI